MARLVFNCLDEMIQSGERVYESRKEMSYSIGVDLGGTNIKIVVVSNVGELLDFQTFDTADTEGSWAQTIKENLKRIEIQRGQAPCHIGIAAPGLASKDGRYIAHMQGRLNGLEGLVWSDFLD